MKNYLRRMDSMQNLYNSQFEKQAGKKRKRMLSEFLSLYRAPARMMRPNLLCHQQNGIIDS